LKLGHVERREELTLASMAPILADFTLRIQSDGSDLKGKKIVQDVSDGAGRNSCSESRSLDEEMTTMKRKNKTK